MPPTCSLSIHFAKSADAKQGVTPISKEVALGALNTPEAGHLVTVF